MASSRRAFLGGALAGAAAPVLTGGVAQAAVKTTTPAAPPATVRRGRALAVTSDARTLVVAHDRRRTIGIVRRRGSVILDVGGQPADLAIAPDGTVAAVTTGAWDEPGLALVDLRSGKVLRRVQAGPAPLGVAFAAGGARIAVVGGEVDGEVQLFDARTLALLAKEPVGISPVAVAAGRRGRDLWVTLAGMGRVTRVSPDTGRAEKSFDVPSTPDRLALSPDGRRLLVTHAGAGANEVSEIDLEKRRLDSHSAGRLPSGVAWAGGSRLVALAGAGEVVEITSGGRRRRHEVGGSPRGLAVARGRAWTVDHLTGRIAKVRS
jgi:DNA-binding beta-propeller fold protein YncE